MKFVNFLISSLLLLTSHAYGDAVIFSGNDVKTLKPNIDLYGQGKILSGSTDPTSVATSAPVGSIYLNTSNGNLYRKVDAGSSTNWQKVGSAAVAGNLLPNPDWETGTTGWTASAGSYARTTTAADVGFGAGSGSFDASAASQTLTSTAVAIPTGLYASNGLASCYIKTAASDYIMQVYDGTNVIGSATIAASTQYTRTNVNFIFPSSGNISLRISSQSNAAIMYMDDCYVGPATNISQVSQAQIYGEIVWPTAAGCSWTINQTSFASDFSANASCTTPTGSNLRGNAVAPATKIPGITFNNLPPGDYMIIARGGFYRGAAAGASAGTFRFYDGTTGSEDQAFYSNLVTNDFMSPVIMGRLSYSTAQSSVTIRVQSKTSAAASSGVYADSSLGVAPLTITVYRFPTSSELAVRSDQAALSWSATGAPRVGSTTATGAFADLTSLSGSYTQVTAQNITCSASSTSVGITCDLPRAGSYEVCHSGWVENGGVNSVQIVLTDASNNILGGRQVATIGGANWAHPIGGCVQYNAASVGSHTIKIRAYGNAGTTTVNSTSFAIKQVSFGTPAPTLVGSVTSATSGALRVEYLRWQDNGSCNIIRQSGPFTVSSRPGTGECAFSVAAGTWSADPVCTCTEASGTGDRQCAAATNTSSLIDFYTRTIGSSPAPVQTTANVVCMGPR